MLDGGVAYQEIIERRGSLARVRRRWHGARPDKGIITRGETDWETVEEEDRILPARTFVVQEN